MIERFMLLCIVSTIVGILLGGAIVSSSYKEEMRRMDFNKTIGEYRKEKGF